MYWNMYQSAYKLYAGNYAMIYVQLLYMCPCEYLGSDLTGLLYVFLPWYQYSCGLSFQMKMLDSTCEPSPH